MIVIWYLLLAAAGLRSTAAINLDIHSNSSINSALSTIAKGLFSYYTHSTVGAGTESWQVGTFPYEPYYWWESGAVWGAMVDYWSYTGDTTYLNMTLDGLAAQVGPNYDFIMPEQAFNEANDDQQFWIYAVLAALEQGMPALPCPGISSTSCPTSYLELAKTAFEEMVQRWNSDSSVCDGGLRWQYLSTMNGWNYKNSISNGGFFQIAARLARYTGEAKYGEWASKIWAWEEEIGLISHDFHIYDGASTDDNCAEITPYEWTYNNAVALYGAAAMFNHTNGAQPWRSRVEGLLGVAEEYFFSPYANATNVMYEWQCEKTAQCNTDEMSFKAYLSRFLGKTAQLAPFVRHRIHSLLKPNAVAAARSCEGGSDGAQCGSRWYVGGYDGVSGLGQSLSALEAIQALLARHEKVPRKAA